MPTTMATNPNFPEITALVAPDAGGGGGGGGGDELDPPGSGELAGAIAMTVMTSF